MLSRRGFATEAFSIPNGILTPGGLADLANSGALSGMQQLEEGLSTLAAETEQAVAAAQLPCGMTGAFALIEWVACIVCEKSSPKDRGAGLGFERVLSLQELLEGLSTHVTTLQQEAREASEAGNDFDRKVVVALAYSTHILTVLPRVFDKSACFYGIEGVSWAVGHYLLTQQ